MKTFVITLIVLNLSQTFGFECGKVQQATGLIHGGSATTIERWPFTASLHYGDDHIFFCGSTIISRKHVLTGAMCIQQKYAATKNFKPENVKVSIGQFDLSRIALADFLSVEKFIVHPDWNSMTANYDSDIAIVVLENDLVFSNKVQPVCLPKDNSIASITDGYITGWGKSGDRDKRHEDVLRQTRMQAVNDTVCFLTNPKLARLASHKTFCAGGNGTGPCMGDSGSGMLVKIDNAWSLKGITSEGIMKNFGVCDPDSFTVFTDVYKFYDWVTEVIGIAALSD